MGARTLRRSAALALFVLLPALAGSAARKPLSSADIGDLARLLKLEDTRRLDETVLTEILKSAHPEVRRRAVLAIGRIADVKGGGALLATARNDKDPDVAATVVFATGQLRDPASVAWLASVLSSPASPVASAREAAIALGKIQAPESRTALATFLMTAPMNARNAPIAGEALLSIGRFPTRDNVAPMVRWIGSKDVEVRWRATWALFRPRNPDALPHLMKLADDPSAEVRSWAVRGLAPSAQGPPFADADRTRAAARLRAALRDSDRHVRTEALRTLATYDDEESFTAVAAALDDPDTWMSVSAAESMARYGTTRASIVVPRLKSAAAAGKPLALRLTVLTPLVTLAPESAIELAAALARESSIVAKTSARQALGRLGAEGRARLDALTAEGVLPQPAPPGPRPVRTALDDEEYRRLVEKWIVPDYNGQKKPHAVWETPRGPIELELYPGDSPMGVEFFVKVVESGAIVGTEFGRVVPDFVDQQRAIRDDVVLRDEVSRRGLTRGNLSWASAGLDTGRPGYTLGVTPQPHNEGNFTALGRVVRGMDAVERIELADKITAARMLR